MKGVCISLVWHKEGSYSYLNSSNHLVNLIHASNIVEVQLNCELNPSFWQSDVPQQKITQKLSNF